MSSTRVNYKVKIAWQTSEYSVKPMYILWKKLYALQPVLRNLQKQYSNIPEKVKLGREDLQKVQQALAIDLYNDRLLVVEQQCRADLNKWLEVEEKMLAVSINSKDQLAKSRGWETTHTFMVLFKKKKYGGGNQNTRR